jgi:predicted phage baseplate assembly protein
MIPSPNLDDRSFDDIVQEAVRLIPQYCPEWTNHNPADPGITLIELFAWMTEMTLYRLNRVPEKNYLAFLELMGIGLTPPQPARAVVQFSINPKADRVVIPNGTRTATKPGPDGTFQTFETTRDVVVTNNALLKCMSQHHETFADNTELLGPGTRGVPLWGGVRSVERFLYVGDPRLAAFGESSMLTINSSSTAEVPQPLVRLLEWEYWDGQRWRELANPSVETAPHEVALLGPVQMAETEIHDRKGVFLRGRLSEVPQRPDDTLTDTLSMRLELIGEGEFPEASFASLDGDLFLKLDMDRSFQPLSREPKVDCAMYIKSDAVFGHAEATIRIDIELADPKVVAKAVPSEDLVIAWEYHNGKRWKLLGKAGIGDFDGEDPGHEFHDETGCLTSPGFVTFRRPKDMRPVGVNGNDGLWVRARIERGDYGVPGSYELENDRWVWKDTRPLRAPTLRGLSLRFVETAQPFESVIAYNDFVYTDHSSLAKEEMKPFQPFTPVTEESPTLYLGFAEPFPNESCQLYIDLVEDAGPGRRLVAKRGDTAKQLAANPSEQIIAWEYWTGREWRPLIVRDHTHGFQQSGFIELVGPKDHSKNKRYGENLYWLRARLEHGGYDEPPLLRTVMLNSAYADNLTTYSDTILGSSKGTPNQSFQFVRGPVLPGQKVWVRERERPTSSELAEVLDVEGDDAIREDPDGDGFLVRWHEVDSLFESKPASRHYTKDIVTGRIAFGDGIRGMLPPKADRNIFCTSYQVGGGAAGNVPPDAITVLLQSVSYVEGVRNVYAASGGADLESVEEAKQRGPHSLKAKGRAVTAEDFEWLAKEASASVARVCALPATDREGEVTVVVVPRVAENHPDFMEKPVASTELLRKVRNYLADRKLLTTVLNVTRPTFRELSVVVEIILLQATAADRVKAEIDRKVRVFLHPLRGGKLRNGWPFGRPVYRVDLYHVVEEVNGVDFVDRVRIIDERTQLEVDQLKIGPGELVHCLRVEVVEKAHERIV